MDYKFNKKSLSKSSPIGVFDSGIGGLTIVKQIAKGLPGEKVLYIGDEAHFPYGEMSQDEICACSREICQTLLERGVKLIVLACNTITSAFLEEARATLPVPVVGVVGAGALAASEATRNKKIGVLATKSTVHSRMYEREIYKLLPDAEVSSVVASKFVQFVENELEDVLSNPSPKVYEAINEYTCGFVEDGVDTIVLGCTHFPPLEPLLCEKLPPDICIVSSGEKTVEQVRDVLVREDLQSPILRNYCEAIKSYEISTTACDKRKFYDFARIVLKA